MRHFVPEVSQEHGIDDHIATVFWQQGSEGRIAVSYLRALDDLRTGSCSGQCQ